MGALRHPFVADCGETRGRLPGHVDGEGGRLTRARVRRHLDRCPGCRRMLERLTAGIAALGALASRSRATDSPEDSIAPSVIAEIRRISADAGPDPPRSGDDA